MIEIFKYFGFKIQSFRMFEKSRQPGAILVPLFLTLVVVRNALSVPAPDYSPSFKTNRTTS